MPELTAPQSKAKDALETMCSQAWRARKELVELEARRQSVITNIADLERNAWEQAAILFDWIPEGGVGVDDQGIRYRITRRERDYTDSTEHERIFDRDPARRNSSTGDKALTPLKYTPDMFKVRYYGIKLSDNGDALWKEARRLYGDIQHGL